MPSALIYRQALSGDIPAMSCIRLAVTENTLSDPARITPAMYEDYLHVRGRGWVAKVQGEVVAFAFADRDLGEIWALFVSPAHEGKGHGRHLLSIAVEWLNRMGRTTVLLRTAAGTRADRFYAKQGWKRAVVSSSEVAYRIDAHGDGC